MQESDILDYEHDERGPSKSQRKRDMAELQQLGKRLTELNRSQLDSMPMSEALGKAITQAQSLKAKEAIRRQLQYIGRLMREEDTGPIRQRLDELDSSTEAFANALHQVESWRTRLLSDDHQQALTEFIETYPDCEIQALRQLIRKAQQDAQQQKNTGAARKLFQFIRELSTGN
jgi:ribosome-associated protein